MSKGYKAKLADGRQIHAIALTNKEGRWLGDVILEHDDAEKWGRYYSITDYGDYGYEWDSIGDKGFEHFLAYAVDEGYLIEKLAMGHDEARVCDIDATIKALREMMLEMWRDDLSIGSDYLGDALDSLGRVEDEPELWRWQGEHSMLAGPEDLTECIQIGLGGRLYGYKAVIIPALKAYLHESLAEAGKYADMDAAACPLAPA